MICTERKRGLVCKGSKQMLTHLKCSISFSKILGLDQWEEVSPEEDELKLPSVMEELLIHLVPLEVEMMMMIFLINFSVLGLVWEQGVVVEEEEEKARRIEKEEHVHAAIPHHNQSV